MKFKPGVLPQATFNPNTPLIGVHAALKRRNSFAMHMLGTSSGDETTEWFGLLGKRLATEHDYSVIWQLWSDTTQSYGVPSYIQTGSEGERYVSVVGTSGNGSRFIHYAPAITGDLDVVAKIEPTAWVTSGTQTIACQIGSSGNQYGWYFAISTTGKLMFKWYPNGDTTGSVTITDTVTRTETGPLWVRFTHDVDNGASGNDVQFYTSTDGSTWTESGALRTTANTTNHFNSSAPFQACTFDVGAINPFVGKVYWLEIRNGIAGTSGVVSVVPPLLERWDCINPTTRAVTLGGSPVIHLHNGSRAAQQTTYFYDPARVHLLNSACDPSVVFLNANHNDAAMTAKTWIDRYKLLIAAAQTYYPDVPIVAQSQSPMKDPKIDSEVWADGIRGARLGPLAVSQDGVYFIDLWRSIDPVTMIGADGIHPNTRGSYAICEAFYNTYFGASSGV